MHELTFQPLLRAAADIVTQPVRPLKQPPTQAAGKPRGVLDSRLVIPGYPFDVAIGPGGVAWLTRVHAAVLERLELRSLASSGSVRVGVAPTRVSLASSGERAWVTNQFTRDVAVVDLVCRRRIGSIAMEGNALGAALSPDERMLYVTTNLDRLCACALSDNGGRIVRSSTLPLVCTEIAAHPAGNRVFVPTWKAGVILEFDARTLSLLRRYEVGGTPVGVAVSRDGLRLYCGNEAGWLDLIHLPNGKAQRRMLETPADEVALTPDQSVLYVSLRPAGQVAILEAHTLNLLGTLETGGLPRHIAFDTAGSVAIIANEAGWVDLVR